VRITKSDIYGNSVGISSDTLSASGHPGFPSDSMVIDRNNIFSNNLNLYANDSRLEPRVGVPVGTGIIWPGMNNGQVKKNYIFDNWRYGTMLFAIPDAFVTPENEIEPGISCSTATPVEDPADNSGQSTSCGNRFFANHMGQAPKGWKPPAGGTTPLKFASASADGGIKFPNGLDFWWDQFPTNTGNCWFDNTGSDGTAAGVTADPPVGPQGTVNEPGTLPDECATSIGDAAAYGPKAASIIECANWSRGDGPEDFQTCDWFETPPQPDGGESAGRSAPAAFEPTDDPAKLRRRMAAAFEDVEIGAWDSRP
jgi:hypothetical protein